MVYNEDKVCIPREVNIIMVCNEVEVCIPREVIWVEGRQRSPSAVSSGQQHPGGHRSHASVNAKDQTQPVTHLQYVAVDKK